jgi:ATP-dependent DNA helicase RecG
MLYSESNNLELKESYTRSYIKTVCAFANERDGRVIFGVNDEGEVIGLDDSKDVRERIEQAIQSNIVPIPNFELETQKVDDKEIVVLTVFQGAEVPYAFDGKFYKRVDTQTVVADGLTVRRWINESKSISFDELTTDEDDLQFVLLGEAMMEATGAKDFNEDSLQILGLKVGKKYTNAGMLFSDTNRSRFGCDAIKFGATRSEFLKRERVIGESILAQYNRMMAFFDENYYNYEAVSNGVRENRIMIPRDAFREALANAIIHRDYRKQSNIQIEFWEDKAVISSPGGLPDGVTEEMYLHQSVSTLRNPVLAMIFLRLRLIESFGTGVWRIVEAYRQFAEDPKFEISGQQIVLTLPKINYQREGNELRKYRTDQVLKALETGDKSRKEIEELLNLTPTLAKLILSSMVENHLIERIGQSRSTKYRKI